MLFDSSNIAHVRQEKNGKYVAQTLDEHLYGTAELAEEFCKCCGENIGKVAGLLHDLGKAIPSWQQYIRKETGFEAEISSRKAVEKVNHSTAGALYAAHHIQSTDPSVMVAMLALAYAIAGHHAGLPDGVKGDGQGVLQFRLSQAESELKDALDSSNGLEQILDEISKIKVRNLENFSKSEDFVRNLNFIIRMIFSALTDADYLDTERFMNPDKREIRESFGTLRSLDGKLKDFLENLTKKSTGSRINQIRSQILDQCLEAAEKEPGIFTLTVPTGGGKTLSSMAFAMKHAEKFAKNRIIYAIPFTSIIEQTADVYRNIFGEDSVVEHHCNMVTESDDNAAGEKYSKYLLATENWDAPIIVTTTVQLFESLFACRSSQCRKLHNIANSVVVIDEAQQIPRDYQDPIVRAMRFYADNFGVTWVLCTATQPVLSEVKDPWGDLLFNGIGKTTEMISDPIALSRELRRTTVKFDSSVTTVSELANDLKKIKTVLCIVNTRDTARMIYEQMDGQAIHLSASMCPAHRSEVISRIKPQLSLPEKDRLPIRVISTQLIEAGVDIDFPVVYREIAGLDSIAQAAGRCNREGRMNNGTVRVFQLNDRKVPAGFLRQGAECTESLLNSKRLDDPLSPHSFKEYFYLMNERGSRDAKGVVEMMTAKFTANFPVDISFRTLGEQFNLIENQYEIVIVPYISEKIHEECSQIYNWLEMIEKNITPKRYYRLLQRYSVSIPKNMYVHLYNIGAIQEKAKVNILDEGYYSNTMGVITEKYTLTSEESVL